MTDIEESYLLLVKHGLNPEPMGEVPYFSEGIPCGIPNLVEAHTDDVMEVPMSLIKKGGTFVVDADGESMTGCGIEDGDSLVIHAQEYAEDGDVVLASIDGESVIKAYFEDDDGVSWLLPQNDKFQPIRLDENVGVVRIYGVVVCIMHGKPKVSYKECVKLVNKAKENNPVPPSTKKIQNALAGIMPIKGNRSWFSVYRVLVDRKRVADEDFNGFASLLNEMMGDEAPEPDLKDLSRMNVGCFRKKLKFWREEDAPVQGSRYFQYHKLASDFDNLLK